ncbi:MAG: hypothetical protein MI923_00130 [Phycisphaerales bacterium]|nr:hypothetical protein [Phycisphaerales bacterium]
MASKQPPTAARGTGAAAERTRSNETGRPKQKTGATRCAKASEQPSSHPTQALRTGQRPHNNREHPPGRGCPGGVKVPEKRKRFTGLTVVAKTITYAISAV